MDTYDLARITAVLTLINSATSDAAYIRSYELVTEGYQEPTIIVHQSWRDGLGRNLTSEQTAEDRYTILRNLRDLGATDESDKSRRLHGVLIEVR